MRARIPDNMLLSDLLKATGYDCPQRLQGKTFNESIAGGGDLRYFDGCNSGISSAPKCFFVIGKHQTTGKTSVMVLAPGATSYCVPQEVIEVTSTTLKVGGVYNKIFPEVTADVVSKALAVLK